MKRILLAEDDKSLAEEYKKAIERGGIEVDLVSTFSSLKSRTTGDYDLAIVNRLFDGKEIDRLLEKGELSFNAPVVLISAHIDAERAAELMDRGVIFDFWHKAEGIPGIVNKLERLKRETRDVREKLSRFYNGVFGLDEGETRPVGREVIAYSPEMVEALSSALRYARRKDLNVVVIGEPGTGRSTLAKYILHHMEPRSPLVVEKGEWGFLEELGEALTVGYGKKVEGGHDVVLIEGLEELPGDEQTYLLNYVKRGKTRVVATATEALYKRLQEGKFSGELYQYLAGGVIYLPPLRKRLKEEVALLIEHFLRREDERRKERLGLSEEAYGILLNYPWPGNLVELEQRLKAAVASLKKGENLIRAAHFPSDMYSEELVRSRNEAIYRNFVENLLSSLDISQLTYEDIKKMSGELYYALLKPFVEMSGGDLALLKKLLKTDEALEKDPLLAELFKGKKKGGQ